MNQAHIDLAVKKGHLILQGKLPGKPIITRGRGPIEKFAEITFQHKNHKHEATYYKMKEEPTWIFDSMVTSKVKKGPSEAAIIDELHGTGFITASQRRLGIQELLSRGIITQKILLRTKRGL